MLCVPVQQSPDQSEGVCLPGGKIHSERLEESDTAQRDHVKVCYSGDKAAALTKWACLPPARGIPTSFTVYTVYLGHVTTERRQEALPLTR